MNANESIKLNTPATSRRRRGSARKRQRTNAPQTTYPAQRNIPAYNLLSDDKLETLETQADWILENIGVEFRGDETALELFRNAGAHIDGERVRFEPGHVRSLCSTAPATFNLHARNPQNTVKLGGNSIVLMPGYGSPFVTDLDSGRRYGTIEDFENFVKLTYLTPYLHHSGGTVCEPTDIPVNKRHLDMVYAHLRYSDKPFMGGVTAPERAEDSIDMARIVFGSSFMEENSVIQANININSPLVFDHTMSGALRVYAAANQCVCVSSAIFGGAMGPVSPAAIVAQTFAEGIVGVALSQLVRPGCPVILGSFHSTMNLKSGALTFGTPEANLVTMALAQMVKRLGIPVRSGGGQITAANIADGQAMTDSANAMWTTMMSGTHQVWHAAGWLEGGLTMSYEKFIMDLDNCGAMLKLFQGMDVTDEDLGRDAYLEITPGQDFLSTGHTMRHFTNANYESLLPEAGPFETWKENGSLDAAQRANNIWIKMLADYKAPTIHPSIDTALKDFIVERKASMPDEWY